MTKIDPGNEVNANPARATVRDILRRVERWNGHGLTAGECVKLAACVRTLHAIITVRPIGWTIEEREQVQRALDS